MKDKNDVYDIELTKKLNDLVNRYGEKGARQIIDLIFEKKRKYDERTKYRDKKEMSYELYYGMINCLFFSLKNKIFSYNDWEKIANNSEDMYCHYRMNHDTLDMDAIINDARLFLKKN